jgi:hypothetical protein
MIFERKKNEAAGGQADVGDERRGVGETTGEAKRGLVGVTRR